MSALNPNESTDIPKIKIPDDFAITHDQLFSQTFRDPSFAKAFLKNVLPVPLLKKLILSKLTVEQNNFFDEDNFKDCRADMVYKIPLLNQDYSVNVFIVLEHKSYEDRLTIFQLARYTLRILELSQKDNPTEGSKASEFLPPVIPIIVYQGEKPFTAPIRLIDLYPPVPDCVAKHLLNFEAILFDLGKIPTSDIPTDPNVWELGIVLRTMQVVFQNNPYSSLEAIFQEIRQFTADPKYLTFAKNLLAYVIYNLKREKLEMKDVKQLNDVLRPEGVDTMATLAEYLVEEGWKQGRVEGREEGREEGIERGREEGIERGREEGIEHGRKQTIISILRARFHAVPPTVQSDVERMCDSIALESLAISAATCESLDEFVQLLK